MIKVLFLLLGFGLFNSCSDEVDQPKLSISIDLKDFKGYQSVLSATDPTSVSSVNCMAVFLKQPVFQDTNICQKANGQVFSFSRKGGLAFSTSGVFNIEMEDVAVDVPSLAFVVGFNVDAATDCPNFTTTPPGSFTPGTTSVSNPFVLGEFPLLIQNNVPAEIALSSGDPITSSQQIANNGCIFSNNGGGPQITNLGLPFGGTGNPNVNLTGGVVVSDTDTSLIPGRTFSASKKVINISNADGKAITLATTLATGEFEAGDEVFFVVLGEDGTGCGNVNIHPGRHGVRKIASRTGDVITLTQEIFPDFASVINANLASAPSNANFCTIQAVRVATLEDINVTANTTIESSLFNYVAGTGGILAIKVNGTVTLNAELILSTAGKGFGSNVGTAGTSGDSYTGEGEISVASIGGGGGATNMDNSNGSGSGASIVTDGSLGGGGGGSAGGVALVTTYTHCSSNLCFMMGSAGGVTFTGAPAGSNGGGIIYFEARNVTGPGNLRLYAHGQNLTGNVAGHNGVGAAAGGQVLMRSQDPGTTNITFDVSGGDADGDGGVVSGSGGAGGLAAFQFCQNSPTSTIDIGGGTIQTGTPSGNLGIPGTDSVDVSPDNTHPFCP
jgi:hypothetical protein